MLADPLAGDSVENHALVAHNTARIGWRQMRDGTFQRSLAEIDAEITRWEEIKIRVVVDSRRTQAELDAVMAQNVIDADAQLAILNPERTSRISTR